MDIPTLASTMVGFLAPFLPYLIKGGEKAAEEAGKNFGAAAWGRAQALWGKLRPKIEAKAAAHEAAQDVAGNPDDEDSLAALRVQLKKLLTEDPALGEALVGEIDAARAAGITVVVKGDRSVGIGGSVSGSTIITGDNNTPQ